MFENVRRLTDEELRDALHTCERAIATAQARQLTVLAEMAHRHRRSGEIVAVSSDSLGDPLRFLADEIAVELSITKLAASHRLHLAIELAARPVVLTALDSGVIDLPKARQITEQLTDAITAGVTEGVTASLEATVVDYARDHTRTQTQSWLRRRLMIADPAAAERAHEVARKSRRVVHYPGVDGMSTLWAQLPAQDAVAVWQMVDRIAKTTSTKSSDAPDDDRTLDQRRADAFTDLVLGQTNRTTHTELLVTVPAATLTGDSDQPGELAGYGPIAAGHARQLADHASSWRQILVDTRTGLARQASTTYRPPAALARLIQVRDQTCRFPGCRRSATSCDLDHTTPWPAGASEPDNLAALCRSHHLLKHHAGWSVSQRPGAILEWTTPSGRTFQTTPHNHQPEAPRARAPNGASA